MKNTNKIDILDIDIESFPQFFLDLYFDISEMDHTVTSENFMEYRLNHYIKCKKFAQEHNVLKGAECCDISIRGLEAYFEMRKNRVA